MLQKYVAAALFGAAILLSGARAVRAAAPLTLEQCYALAEGYSRPVRMQQEQKNQAVERLKQAQGGRIFQAHLNYLYDYRGTSGATGDGSQLQLGASQPLFEGYRLSYAVKAAAAQVRRQDLLLESVRRSIHNDVASAFYTLAQIESDINNINDIVDLLNSRFKELRERVRLGKSRESEMLVVESQIAALQAQGEQLKGARANAAEDLSGLIGLPAGEVRIRDTLPLNETAGPVDDYVARALLRPDVAAAEEAAAEQQNLVGIARGALLPSLNLAGYWNPDRSGTLAGPDWQTQLAFSMPLFQGGILRSRVREAQSRLRELQDNVTNVRRIVVTEVRQQYNNFTSAVAQKAALENSYAKSEKSYQLQMKDYRLGLVNNLDVLSAMNSLLTAKESRDRAVLQEKLFRVLLEIAAEPAQ